MTAVAPVWHYARCPECGGRVAAPSRPEALQVLRDHLETCEGPTRPVGR